MDKAVCLLSGGLDSTTALALACESGLTTAVSFDYGQRHRSYELAAAKQVAEHYGVEHVVVNLQQLQFLLKGSALTERSIDVPEGHYTHPSMAITVVPNRNAIMLSIVFGIARGQEASTVWAGMHAGDHPIYPDCRPDFMQAFAEMERLANVDLPFPIALITPFINRTKAEIVRIGTDMKVPYELTYSCYKGKLLHCGVCGTCVERREAFKLVGVHDPTNYSQVPV